MKPFDETDAYRKPEPGFFGPPVQGKRNKTISKRQESVIQKTGVRGKLTPGSGNKGIKGDVWKKSSSPFFGGRMYEAKTTEKASMKVERGWLEKLERESFAATKEPVFVFGFYSDALRQSDWGCVPLARLEELFEIEQKYYDRERET